VSAGAVGLRGAAAAAAVGRAAGRSTCTMSTAVGAQSSLDARVEGTLHANGVCES
jgi:hypothetical protein